MRINETVKELRLRENMTQVELAEKLNCNRQKIADWERGKTTPAADDIILLAKIFNVSADYLLGLTDTPTIDKDLRFISDYTQLDYSVITAIHELKGDGIKLINNIIKTVIEGL